MSVLVKEFPGDGIENEGTSWRSSAASPRSIFVSDTHLGCKHGRASDFLKLLQAFQPEYLYLVGDIIDGWRLARSWYWTECYSQILKRFYELTALGTKVFYIPGNHDEFMRPFLSSVAHLGHIRLANQFIHQTADGRRLLVIHGDQFDRVVSKNKLLSHWGDRAYSASMAVDRIFNRVWESVGRKRVNFSRYLKHRVKSITNRICDFEGSALSCAAALGCDGVICGHIHHPEIRISQAGLVYYNTGDWLENTTAIFESDDGQLAITFGDY